MGFWTTVVVTVSTTLAVVELVRFLWGDDSSTGSDLGSAGPGRNIRRPAQEGPPREPATRPPPFDPYSFQPLRPASDASHRIPPGPWSETAPVPTSSRVYGVSGRGRPRTRLRIVPRPVASPPSAPSYPFQPFVPASDASYENPPSLRSEDTSVLISRRGRTRRPASYPIPPSTRSEDASAPRPITAEELAVKLFQRAYEEYGFNGAASAREVTDEAMQNWLNSWNGIASEIMEQPASRPAPGLRPEDVSATTAKLRERAEEEYQLKRQAVDYGLPADEAASHREAMEFLNRVASEMIFFEKNKHGRPRQIDLHGLRVDEAKSRVDAIIILEDLSPNPVPFRFIVGKGRHNGDGRPRLRPALLEYIEAMPDYLVQVDPYNEGVIMVTNRETLRDP